MNFSLPPAASFAAAFLAEAERRNDLAPVTAAIDSRSLLEMAET